MTEQDLKFKIELYCKRKRNVKTKKNNKKAKGEASENAMSYPSDIEKWEASVAYFPLPGYNWNNRN